MQRDERTWVTVPEAAPRPPDVPVRKLLDEVLDRSARGRRVELVEPLADDRDGRLQSRIHPPIELGSLADGRRLDRIRVCVQHVEAVRVPKLKQKLADSLSDRLEREAVA